MSTRLLAMLWLVAAALMAAWAVADAGRGASGYAALHVALAVVDFGVCVGCMIDAGGRA